MRILLAAKHAPHGRRPIGGVQSWCRTVARELQRRGHDAVTWGPEQPVPLGGFDLGIIANAADASRAFDLCAKTINVSHGIIDAEKPARGDLVAFTSEEIRDHWKVEGIIVRQPIDLEFWSPINSPRIYLTQFTYRRGLRFVKHIARAMSLREYHLRGLNAEGVRRVLHKSRVVLATGRAALESMACGIPTVICDHRAAYQGPLMDLDVEGAMTRNYSGRGGIVPDIDNLKSAIDDAIEFGSRRSHVLRHHDVANVVDDLLEAA